MGDNLFNLYTQLLALLLENHFSTSLLLLSETMFSFSQNCFYYAYSTNYTFVFTSKLAVCLVFLSAIRGGVPRYRYDFLTKMGWVKFLGLVLSVFLLTFLTFLVW